MERRIDWTPFQNRAMGVIGAEPHPGVTLRVIETARAVRTKEPSYLAWVDAFRKTYTSARAQPTIEDAKRAAVDLAVDVALEKQETVRRRLERQPAQKAYAQALEQDLQTLNTLLITLLDEAEALGS